MERDVRSTIRNLIRNHLKKIGKVFSQCLTAVGWVDLPELYEKDGMLKFQCRCC